MDRSNENEESNNVAVSSSDLNQSFNDVNKALSEYLRQVELHRAYYALKTITQNDSSNTETL